MESCKRCSIPFEKTQSCSKRCGMPLSGQYSCAICSLSSVYSHLFNMQNSCQKVQYPMHQSNLNWTSCEDDYAACTWQFSQKTTSYFFQEAMFLQKQKVMFLTPGMFLLKRLCVPCLLSKNSSLGEISFAQYKELCTIPNQLFPSFCRGYFFPK